MPIRSRFSIAGALVFCAALPVAGQAAVIASSASITVGTQALGAPVTGLPVFNPDLSLLSAGSGWPALAPPAGATTVAGTAAWTPPAPAPRPGLAHPLTPPNGTGLTITDPCTGLCPQTLVTGGIQDPVGILLPFILTAPTGGMATTSTVLFASIFTNGDPTVQHILPAIAIAALFHLKPGAPSFGGLAYALNLTWSGPPAPPGSPPGHRSSGSQELTFTLATDGAGPLPDVAVGQALAGGVPNPLAIAAPPPIVVNTGLVSPLSGGPMYLGYGWVFGEVMEISGLGSNSLMQAGGMTAFGDPAYITMLDFPLPDLFPEDLGPGVLPPPFHIPPPLPIRVPPLPPGVVIPPGVQGLVFGIGGQPVPEPASLAIFAGGLLALGALVRGRGARKA